MSAVGWDLPAPRSTVYSVGDRRIRRDEIIGREGYDPPMFITWHDHDTGEILGTYELSSAYRDAVTWGPMFL